jgi:hypothetical protein
VIPPENFLDAGTVHYAYFLSGEPPYIRRKRFTGRRAAGIRYERKAQEYLQYMFPDTYVSSPWLAFKCSYTEKSRWCQPDGLVIDVPRGIITCVEIKYNHTSDAWWQTKQLYAPVLRKVFRPELWQIQFCEVVKWYDPSIRFPEPIQLTMNIDQPSSKFKVHIWRP